MADAMKEQERCPTCGGLNGVTLRLYRPPAGGYAVAPWSQHRNWHEFDERTCSKDCEPCPDCRQEQPAIHPDDRPDCICGHELVEHHFGQDGLPHKCAWGKCHCEEYRPKGAQPSKEAMDGAHECGHAMHLLPGTDVSPMYAPIDRAISTVTAAQAARVKELEEEIEILRRYGNKDCTAMADEELMLMRGAAQALKGKP